MAITTGDYQSVLTGGWWITEGVVAGTTGTVAVAVTPNTASWTLYGPGTFNSGSPYTGTGDESISDCPTGEYRLVCDSLSNYETPGQEYGTLAESETLTLTTVYPSLSYTGSAGAIGGFIERCNIRRNSGTTLNASREKIASWSNVATDVPCRISVRTVNELVNGIQSQVEKTFLIVDKRDIEEEDEITIGSETYHVQAVKQRYGIHGATHLSLELMRVK